MLSGVDDEALACLVCGKTFTSNAYLEGHAKTHSSEKAFSCMICSKLFSCQRTLKLHGRVHSDDRPFECPKCNKSFKHKGHLTWHMKTHTGKCLFSCSYCRKQLNDARSLYYHEKKCKIVKENNVLATLRKRGRPKGVKIHKQEGDLKEKAVVMNQKSDSTVKPLPLQTSKESFKQKIHLSGRIDQKQIEDAEIIDNDQVSDMLKRKKENAKVVETRDNEYYFDPSPGWKLWKSWDVWDKIGESEETVDDESDMDATSPGWKLWKNWDIWDVWKNTQSIPKE